MTEIDLHFSEADERRLHLASTVGPPLGVSEQDRRILSVLLASEQPVPTPTESHIYAPTSPWNTPIPSSAVVRPDSATMVARLLGQDSQKRLHDGNSTGAYSRGAWHVKESDPIVVVQLSEPWGTNMLNGAKIPCPANAKPAPGSDGHMALWLPGGPEVDLWQAQAPSGGVLRASWGGRGLTDGSGFDTFPYGGGTASGANLLAGLPTAAEFAAATATSFETINHAIFVTSATCQKGHLPPAVHDDGRSTDVTLPQQGQRFRLPFSREQIAASSAKPWLKALASAFSRYGCIVGDSGGPGFGWLPESSLPFTANGLPDPLEAVAKREGLYFDSIYRYAFSTAAIDWRQLQALKPF